MAYLLMSHILKALFFSSILLISNSIMPSVFASDNSTIFPELQVPDISKKPPLQQVKWGIDPTSVTCKQGLQLMIKTGNGSPACVRSDIAKKLVEQGWGHLQEQTMWFEYNFMACQKTPWREWGKNLQGVYSENDLIREYFKEQGITILDAKVSTVQHSTGVLRCNLDLLAGYYFHVYVHDKDKMIKLGYEYFNHNPIDAIPID